jgi:hypothetical protein
MSLSDLNEQLHSRPEGDGSVSPDHSEIEAPAAPLSETLPASEEPLPEPPRVPVGEAWLGMEKEEVIEINKEEVVYEDKKALFRKRLALGLGGVALLALAIGVTFKLGGWLFLPDNITVSWSGPQAVGSNESVEYLIRFENKNWVDLEQAELVVTYPEIFRFASDEPFEVSASRAVLPLDTVKKSSVNTIRVRGSFQSFQDQVGLFTATLRAAPKGVSSQVAIEGRYSVAVESSALIIDLSVPPQVGSGQKAAYVVTYRNESEERVDNLELRLEYPEGFAFSDAQPAPVADQNVWRIAALGPGESGMLTVNGTLVGQRGDVKRLVARLGKPQGDGALLAYAETERSTRVIASPLVIFQTVGDTDQETVEPGENLQFKLSFRNDGDIGLRDLIVTVDVDPNQLDVARINLSEGGTYSVAKRQVIFRAADRPVLAGLDPGESGEIRFSLPVRNDLSKFGRSDIEVRTVARIDSPDVPTPIGANKIIASNERRFKVASAVLLDLKGYYYDSYGNAGPLPPRVGEETTYTLSARALSTLNNLETARVVISLPASVRYVKTHTSNQGTVVYNDRTGEIFWNIGTLAPGDANLAMLVIQIGFTPAPSQVGQYARIVNGATFTGRDAYAGTEVKADIKAKTTELTEDAQLTAAQASRIQSALSN